MPIRMRVTLVVAFFAASFMAIGVGFGEQPKVFAQGPCDESKATPDPLYLSSGPVITCLGPHEQVPHIVPNIENVTTKYDPEVIQVPNVGPIKADDELANGSIGAEYVNSSGIISQWQTGPLDSWGEQLMHVIEVEASKNLFEDEKNEVIEVNVTKRGAEKFGTLLKLFSRPLTLYWTLHRSSRPATVLLALV